MRQGQPRGATPFLIAPYTSPFRRWVRPCIRFAAAGLGLLVVGCTVGPDYVRPPAVVPLEFKEAQGWKAAEPGDAVARGAWWEIFGDPQLNVLEAQIEINNQNLAAAEAQFRQARAQVQAARAGFFPTLTVGPSVTSSLGQSGGAGGRSSSGSGGGSRARSGNSVDDFLLSGNLSWELDIWGKVRRTVESARAGAQASAGDLQSARLSAQAELAQDYLQLRTLDAQKELLEATITGYRKFLEVTRNRYASGVAARSDVLQAETQLLSTQAQSVDLGVQRAQLEHAVALLIGRPPADFAIPFSPLHGYGPPPVPMQLPSELLERRPDIAAAERRVAAANAQIGVAEAAFYPTITLSALGGFSSTHLSDWLTWPSRFWAVGGTLSEAVFEGGLRKAQTDQAIAAYDAAVADYRQTVLGAFQEVEDNLAALRILEREAGIQGEAVKAADQSVVVTNNRYHAGLASSLDVIVVQAIALNNDVTAVNILGRRMTAAVLLVKGLGGGWQASMLPPDGSL